VPTLELAAALGAEARTAAPELLVSVGSGVVSDLVKKASRDLELPNWCVATAPSVDAYTSGTSNIRVEGYAAPLPACPSGVVICDLEVVSRAPREMFLAGLGDLLAKFIAYLDWNLSRILTGEYYCETVEGFSLESARKALAAAREMGADVPAAARSLTDAVLVSGLAMQALRSSRPAASAEHTIAHYWGMAGAAGNAALDLHGILVGAASRVVLHAYRSFYRAAETADPDVRARIEALACEPHWEEQVDPQMRPFLGKMREEMRGRGFDRGKTAARLDAFRREKGRILEMAARTLEELSGAVELLESLGYPFPLRKLEISPRSAALAVRHLRFLRDRYSTFDLAHELGLEGELAAEAVRCVESEGP
jgi:glycerol-1-phosphate dehydrogenase [NAD(P)+]